MDDTSYQEGLRIIRTFLAAQHFSAKNASMTRQDGHWMLWWIETKADCCPSARSASLLQLLSRLEQGCHITGDALQPGDSNWQRRDSRHVLEITGISEKKLEQYS